jgi:hypothetical protein
MYSNTKNNREQYRKVQTRKHKVYNQYGGTDLPKYANTFHGLHCWYEAKFEKLGWMVLAKEKGYDYKIESYKIGLEDLLKSIEHVMAEYEEEDRKHDLRVLHMNAKCLHDFVMKTM